MLADREYFMLLNTILMCLIMIVVMIKACIYTSKLLVAKKVVPMDSETKILLMAGLFFMLPLKILKIIMLFIFINYSTFYISKQISNDKEFLKK